MVPTSYDLRSRSRVTAGRDLSPGTPLLALDHNHGILLTLVLDVPYSVVRNESKCPSKIVWGENEYRIVLSAEEVINLFSWDGSQ